MFNLMRNINPTQAYISEYVPLDHGIVAHRYGIIGTSFVCYAVYQQTPGWKPGQYSSITHTDEHGWMGDITTVALPAAIDALMPYSKERSQKVTAFFDELKQQAEAIIRATFPQDFVEQDCTCEACVADQQSMSKQG